MSVRNAEDSLGLAPGDETARPDDPVRVPQPEPEEERPRRKSRPKKPRPTFEDGALTRVFKFPSKTFPRSSYYVTGTEIIIRIRKFRKRWKLVIPKKRVVSYRTNRWFAKPRWVEIELTFTQATRLGLIGPAKGSLSEAIRQAQGAPDPTPSDTSQLESDDAPSQDEESADQTEATLQLDADGSDTSSEGEMEEDEATAAGEGDGSEDTEDSLEAQADEPIEPVAADDTFEPVAAATDIVDANEPPELVAAGPEPQPEPGADAPILSTEEPVADAVGDGSETHPVIVAETAPAAPADRRPSDEPAVPDHGASCAPGDCPRPVEIIIAAPSSAEVATLPEAPAETAAASSQTSFTTSTASIQEPHGATASARDDASLLPPPLTSPRRWPALLAAVCAIMIASTTAYHLLSDSTSPVLVADISERDALQAAPIAAEGAPIVTGAIDMPSRPAASEPPALPAPRAAETAAPQVPDASLTTQEPSAVTEITNTAAEVPVRAAALDALAPSAEPPAPAPASGSVRAPEAAAPPQGASVETAEAKSCRLLGETAGTTRIEFDYASARLEASQQVALSDLAQLVKSCPAAMLIIEGHADADGDPDRNQSVSVRRSQAVRDLLVAAGTDPRRMSVIGFGNSRPLVPNDSQDNKRRNRRAAIVVDLSR